MSSDTVKLSSTLFKFHVYFGSRIISLGKNVVCSLGRKQILLYLKLCADYKLSQVWGIFQNSSESSFTSKIVTLLRRFSVTSWYCCSPPWRVSGMMNTPHNLGCRSLFVTASYYTWKRSLGGTEVRPLPALERTGGETDGGKLERSRDGLSTGGLAGCCVDIWWTSDISPVLSRAAAHTDWAEGREAASGARTCAHRRGRRREEGGERSGNEFLTAPWKYLTTTITDRETAAQISL